MTRIPLRVVFLTHNFPRFEGDVSGSFLAVLARALLARDIAVQVIAPSDAGDAGPDSLGGVPVRRVRYASPARETLAYRGTMADTARTPGGAWAAWSLIRAMRRAAREEIARGADLIHAHWWIPAGLAAPASRPLVVTLHGTDATILDRSGIARSLARPVLRRARVVTAVSGTVAESVYRATGRRIGFEHQQPMPADISRYQSWSAGGGGLVIVARLTAQKRVHLALRALSLLADRAMTLTVVGDGPERSTLESLTQDLGIAHRVAFVGAVAPGRVAEILQSADLAIFPARLEGFGLAAAEAFMTGVPVVACDDGGGVLSVVPAGGAGRIVPPEPQAIAAAIESLVRDPESREQARSEGTRWRERLGPAHVAEVCELWYREALSA